MQVYYGLYKILDWPYWFYVFILSFVISVNAISSVTLWIYSPYGSFINYILN